jgi:hypothetical protein
MSAPAPVPAAQEINGLHAEVVRQTGESKHALHAALAAAWRAGQLLLAEKKRIRRKMGGGAWLLWLEGHFRGSRRTAQNYMRLAETVADVSFLQGMSLRLVYLRLGIATEPKSRAGSVPLQTLPSHLRLAHRLLAALQPCAQPVTPEQREAYRQDLRPLYERLRLLFEPGVANIRGAVVSNKP